MNRMLIRLLTLLWLPSIAFGQFASVSSDPIQRIREARGNVAFGLFANYLPTGSETSGENSNGEPGLFTSTSHYLGLEAFGVYNFGGDRFVLSFSLIPSWLWQTQEFVSQAGVHETHHHTEENWNHSIGLDWRLINTEKSEVRVGTSVQVDHWVGLHTGGFLITDPLVLEFQAAHFQHDEGLSELGLSNGVGFVVNDLVSLAVLGGVQIPLNETIPPEWQVAFQVRFRTDALSRFETVFQGLSRISSGQIHPGIGGGFINWGRFNLSTEPH